MSERALAQKINEDIAELLTRLLHEQNERTKLDRQRIEDERKGSEHDAQMAEAKARTFKTWASALVMLLTICGSVIVWAANYVKSNNNVSNAIDQINKRDDVQDQKISGLRETAIEQQVQIADSVGYIRDMLKEVDPATKNVKVPETVQKAEDKAKKIKAEKKIDLFADE